MYVTFHCDPRIRLKDICNNISAYCYSGIRSIVLIQEAPDPLSPVCTRFSRIIKKVLLDQRYNAWFSSWNEVITKDWNWRRLSVIYLPAGACRLLFFWTLSSILIGSATALFLTHPADVCFFLHKAPTTRALTCKKQVKLQSKLLIGHFRYSKNPRIRT